MQQKLKVVILILLAVLLAFGLVNAAETGASKDFKAWLGNTILKGATNVLILLTFALIQIGAFFFNLGALLVQLGLLLNNQIMKSEVVLIGWRIMRDIANLGFVVGIIIIAYATMLRIEGYALKKVLANLVVVALLVNFSLAIAGVLIDTSNLFTNFFVSKASGSGASDVKQLDGFVNNLAFAFSPQALATVNEKNKKDYEGVVDNLDKLLGVLLNAVFVLFFTVFAAEGILAVAIITFFRYITLSILLIMLPLAALAWVFPNMRGWWNHWWTKFIHNVISLPVAMFFIYLAIYLVSQKAQVAAGTPIFNSLNQAARGVTGQAVSKSLVYWVSPVTQIGQMFVVWFLLHAGLVAARRMGAAGAEASIGFATGVRNAVLGLGSQYVGKLGFVKNRPGLARTIEALGKPGLAIGRRATQIRAALTGVAGEKERGEKKEKEEKRLDRAALLKQYNSLSSVDRLKLVGDKALLSDPVKAGALLASIAQSGELESLAADDFNLLKETAKANGDRTILKYMPHLAEEFGTTIKDVMGGLRPEEISKLSHKSLANVGVVSELNQAHIEKIGATGIPNQMNAIINTLTDNFDKMDKDKIEGLVETMSRGKGSLTWKGSPRLTELSDKVDKYKASKAQVQPTIIAAPKVIVVPSSPPSSIAAAGEKVITPPKGTEVYELKKTLAPEAKVAGPPAPQVAATAPPTDQPPVIIPPEAEKLAKPGPTIVKFPEPGGEELKKAA